MADTRNETRIKRKFGGAVQSCRHDLDVSQEELAHRAGVHRTYLADIERGFRNPSLKVICRIAHALEVSVATLMEQAEL